MIDLQVSDQELESAARDYVLWQSDIRKHGKPWVIVLGRHPSNCIASARLDEIGPSMAKKVGGSFFLKRVTPLQAAFLYLKHNVSNTSIAVFDKNAELRSLRAVNEHTAERLLHRAILEASRLCHMPWKDRIKSFALFLRQTIISLLKREKVVLSLGDQNKRWLACQSCVFFHAASGRCKSCGCKLDIKTKYTKATCPENKWPV